MTSDWFNRSISVQTDQLQIKTYKTSIYKSIHLFRYGCCADGFTKARGPNDAGCPATTTPPFIMHGTVSPFKVQSCGLPQDQGNVCNAGYKLVRLEFRQTDKQSDTKRCSPECIDISNSLLYSSWWEIDNQCELFSDVVLQHDRGTMHPVLVRRMRRKREQVPDQGNVRKYLCRAARSRKVLSAKGGRTAEMWSATGQVRIHCTCKHRAQAISLRKLFLALAWLNILASCLYL